MQATSFDFGIITTPGYRYHPAILAQASATLSEMFPKRFWLCLDSGEYLNEAFTGLNWPTKEERNKRLRESIEIIRRLWSGERVTHYGSVTTEEARLYTKPKQPPLLMDAALTAKTAKWLTPYTDGLITVAGSPKELEEKVKTCKTGDGQKKPIFVKIQVSYAPNETEALESAWQNWRYNVLGSSVNSNLRSPEMFDEASKNTRPEDVNKQVFISNSVERHAEWLSGFLNAGADRLYIHNVNREQKRFLEFYRKVLSKVER